MRFTVTLLLGFLLIPTYAYGGGFQLHYHGMRQLGMAHTGTGLALDASSLFFNPGALVFSHNLGLQVGGSKVMSYTAFLKAPRGVEVFNTEPVFHTPFYAYLAWRTKVHSPISFGIAVNNPFGMHIKWPENWDGRFLAQEVSITTLFIQPTMSIRINDKLGIGVGLVVGNTDMMKKEAIDYNLDTVIPSVVFSSHATGIGFNAGLYFRPNESLSLGLNYRSHVTSGPIEGDATFDVPAFLERLYPDSPFQSEIALPSVLSFGLGYRPQQAVLIAFDINYTGWGIYDSLLYDFEKENIPVEEFNSVRHYKNSFSVRLGAEVKMTDNLAIRFGTFYDTSPVQDDFVSPALPDANSVGFTGGLGLKFHKRFGLDMSFVFESTGERTSNFEAGGFEGIYETNIFVAGLGIHYSF